MKNYILKTVALLILLGSSAYAVTIGPIEYTTAVASGYEEDTLVVLQLYSYAPGETFIGKYVWIAQTTDGGAPQNQACQILGYAATSGLLILDKETEGAGNDAVLGLTATITKGDIIYIMDNAPPGALVRRVYTATKAGSGVDYGDATLYINNSLDTLAKVLSGAGGLTDWSVLTATKAGTNGAAGFEVMLFNQNSLDTLAIRVYGDAGIPVYPAAVAPGTNGSNLIEGLRAAYDKIDSLQYEWNSTRGVTTDPAGLFHAAGVSGLERINFIQDSLRKVGVSTDSILAYIHSTTGAPAVTGAFPAAGLSILERIQFIADSLRKVAVNSDSILFYLHSTTGAPAVTGTFPAAGVSVLEQIGFLCDSLRKVGVTTDSTWAYLATTAGAQWGTATEPANGVNLFEGLGFAQNQLDSLVGMLNGNVGNDWDSPAQWADGVAFDEVIASIQDLIDSLRVELFAAGGVAAFPAAEAPANGVPLAGAVHYNADLLEGVRDSLEDANDLLQKFNGVTTGFVDENIWTTVEVVVNFDPSGAWEEAASTHELFTVTGDVEYEISAYCSTNVGTTSSDSLWLYAGESGATGYRALSFLGDDADAGEGLFVPGASSALGTIMSAAVLSINAGGVFKGTIYMGKDIGYAISDHDFTGGIVVFYCRWRPLTTGGAVVAGAGGSL